MADIEQCGQYSGSDLVLEQDSIRVFKEDNELGKGTLAIRESALYWKSEDNEQCLRLQYPSIIVHAVSRDTSSFPLECVFLLYQETEDEDADGGLEIRLVPTDTNKIEAIYGAISECQQLYPDPELSSDSEVDQLVDDIDEDGDYYTSADGLQHLTPEGEAVLAHLESILRLPGDSLRTETGQFEDVD